MLLVLPHLHGRLRLAHVLVPEVLVLVLVLVPHLLPYLLPRSRHVRLHARTARRTVHGRAHVVVGRGSHGRSAVRVGRRRGAHLVVVQRGRVRVGVAVAVGVGRGEGGDARHLRGKAGVVRVVHGGRRAVAIGAWVAGVAHARGGVGPVHGGLLLLLLLLPPPAGEARVDLGPRALPLGVVAGDLALGAVLAGGLGAVAPARGHKERGSVSQPVSQPAYVYVRGAIQGSARADGQTHARTYRILVDVQKSHDLR